MRIICIFTGFVIFCLPGYCQPGAGGIKPGTDTAAINRLLHTADKVLNPDSAILLFNDALKQSIAANYADGAFKATITKGIKYFEKQDFENARNCFSEAIPWAKKATKKDAVAWCYNNIGLTYINEGDQAKASEYYYIALGELNKLPDSPTTTAVNNYVALANINRRLNQMDTASVYFDKAENIARRGKFYFQLAQILNIKGEDYLDGNKIDSAQKKFTETLEIGKKIGKVDLQALADVNLGKCLVRRGEYQKAIAQIKMAFSLAKDKFEYIVIGANFGMGDALYHLRKYKEAEYYVNSVLSEIKEHNAKNEYIECYTELVNIYRAAGEYKNALNCTDSIDVLKDSLTGAEKAKAIKLVEIKYKTAEKDKEIAQNQLLIAEQKNKIASKNTWITGIAGGICLLLLVSALLYSRARHKQRLQAQEIKSLQHENTISILKGVVQGEENERGRLARELHDGIGGIVSAAMMRFMAIRHDNSAITQIPAYTEAIQLLDEAADEIRKTAHNLMPEVLMKQTLPEAVSTYCNSVQQGGDLQIDFQCYGTFDDLTQDFKLNVYRIIQELLKNITEHARASKALVQLIMHEHTLTITVEDNGIGFDTGEIKKGIGLRNMQTRVSSLEGQFTLESQMGKGTTVYIETPVKT